MIEISLTQLSRLGLTPQSFAALAESQRKAQEAHMMGRPGVPRPAHHPIVDSVIQRVPDSNPNIAARGPDTFEIVPYQIIDDTPKTPEQLHALSVLRESIQ